MLHFSTHGTLNDTWMEQFMKACNAHPGDPTEVSQIRGIPQLNGAYGLSIILLNGHWDVSLEDSLKERLQRQSLLME